MVILLFFILALVQASFLPYFSIMGASVNLVFILFFTLVFFENPGELSQSIFFAAIAGFFLDIASPFYFGYAMVSLVLVYFFVKMAGYFLRQSHDKHAISYFIPLFLCSLIFYNTLLYISTNIYHVQFNIGWIVFINLAYNAALAIGVFWIYKNIDQYHTANRQLHLFK